VAAREQSGTNIDPGILQRVAAGIRYAVSGVAPDNWFGPSQPIAPQAQEQAEGRAFDYPVGFNLRITPRGEEAISFGQLRSLADGYDLMRLIIEKRKDQIEAFDWEIVPKDKTKNADQFQDAIRQASDFLERPDQQNNWQQWLRQVIEEMLVIDTVCVYPRQNRGGKLYGFELVDGATIKRVLDVTGRTPLPPDPAYQQILKGIPAVDYSSDQLVYTMRNPRVWKIYGFSPVEQVITTVNIALRRQMSQLAFYTEGNVPEALAQVPETWTSKQVQEFQLWWDTVMEGNLAARRKMRFIPNLKGIEYPKKDVLKDEYDEWLARIVCFAFSISPSALIKQVNRASGEQMADTAKEEGLMPLLRFLEAFMSMLVQRYLGRPDLKFAFKVVNRVSPEEQAKIHSTYVNIEALTPDEVREELGKDAMPPEERARVFPMPLPFNQAVLDQGGNDEIIPAFQEPGGKDGKGVTPPASAKPKPKAEETPAEKMLALVLPMLDPKQLAKVISDAAASQAPRVVEVRPEVNVEVGDTNVHLPERRVYADAALAKREADASRALESLANAQHVLAKAVTDRGEPVIKVENAAPVVNVAAPNVTVNTPEVTVNLPAPEVRVEAPVSVTNTLPEPRVEIHHAPAGASEELIERDRDSGEITRVVKRPIK